MCEISSYNLLGQITTTYKYLARNNDSLNDRFYVTDYFLLTFGFVIAVSALPLVKTQTPSNSIASADMSWQ